MIAPISDTEDEYLDLGHVPISTAYDGAPLPARNYVARCDPLAEAVNTKAAPGKRPVTAVTQAKPAPAPRPQRVTGKAPTQVPKPGPIPEKASANYSRTAVVRY